MKIKWNLLLVAVATTLLLSACGTSPDADKDKADNTANGSADTVGKVEVDEATATDARENVMKGAKLTESDEQNYAISVLPDYTLTSEEPGKDSLMPIADESVFMRIETMSKKDVTYDYLLENMDAVLEASSDGGTPVEVTDEASIPAGEGIENAKARSVKADTATVTGIIFERGDMIVRLTIYDTTKEEHFESFLRMGETIISK
jgi:hypothetical protein